MTSFTFTPEQVRSAPLEVRRWIVHEIAQTLAAVERPTHDPSQVKSAALAALASEEAAHVFAMIRDNFVLSQVFFELARDAAPGPRGPPLHALNTGDILRHTRLADGDGLIQCLSAINEAFRQVRRDPEATLFGFDQHGHVFIHETTHLSIRQLWEQQLRPVPAAVIEGADAAPRTMGFAPPYLGPSDDIATHAAHQPDGPNS